MAHCIRVWHPTQNGAADALRAATALEGRLAQALPDAGGTVWAGAVQEVAQQRSMLLLWAEPAAAGQEGDRERGGPACAGYILVKHSSLAAHIATLAVAPEHRRHGLGRALVQAALEQEGAGPGGRRDATLVVGASNAPALALYERLGFQPEGPPLADWYGPGLHAQRMVLPAGSRGNDGSSVQGGA